MNELTLPPITRYTGPCVRTMCFYQELCHKQLKIHKLRQSQSSQRIMSLCFTKLYLISPMPAGQHNIPARVNSHATQEIST